MSNELIERAEQRRQLVHVRLTADRRRTGGRFERDYLGSNIRSELLRVGAPCFLRNFRKNACVDIVEFLDCGRGCRRDKGLSSSPGLDHIYLVPIGCFAEAGRSKGGCLL